MLCERIVVDHSFWGRDRLNQAKQLFGIYQPAPEFPFCWSLTLRRYFLLLNHIVPKLAFFWFFLPAGLSIRLQASKEGVITSHDPATQVCKRLAHYPFRHALVVRLFDHVVFRVGKALVVVALQEYTLITLS